jgi:hypothetical protein
MFSRRLPENLEPNALALFQAAKGRAPYDLTVSNPTACSLPYPDDLLATLAEPIGLGYDPDPRGRRPAREAIARYYDGRGIRVDPDRIVLTASSSEAYGFLFKLLCDPGDSVAVPVPSYPLFEHLARLDGVRALPYRLDAGEGWQPDARSLEDLAGERLRAIIAVHPNNPTGSFLLRGARESLVDLCARRGAGLIVDEVFLDYPLDPAAAEATFAGAREGLVFVLGGLSKSCGLPQLKLSWIVLAGADAPAEDALRRLEFIADNYLSVGTPVQLALGQLLRAGASVREAILERCRANLAWLLLEAPKVPGLAVVPPQGGWSVVARYPHVIAEDALALELLELDGVAIHPGYFFDFEGEGYLVSSLLPKPETFREGWRRILACVAALV